MRDNQFILVDLPARKLAVFANDSGQVVTASLEVERTHIGLIEPEEVARVVAALLAAQIDAQEVAKAIEPDYLAYEAISKAMGAA